MAPSDAGLVPAGNFLQSCLQTRPSFNDGSKPSTLDVSVAGTTSSLTALRTPRSSYGQHIRYCVHEFTPLLDSSAVSAPVWLQIATIIHANYALFSGFIVLHGTDTLAFSASALSFMLQDLGKPVILTGSQRPMGELQNDATDNLLGSLIIAAHFNIPEVLLYFNYKLLRGNRATKVSATEYDAFASPNLPPLATITSTGVHVRWDLVRQADPARTFCLQRDFHTAHVAYVRVFPGITSDLVDMIVRARPTRGLVLESFGAGNIPSGPDGRLLQVLADAVARGIVIVNVTQCLNGNVSPLYAPAKAMDAAGVLLGYDMTSEAALTKLSYLLAVPGGTREEIKRLMGIDMRGEMTRTEETWFGHPPGSKL